MIIIVEAMFVTFDYMLLLGWSLIFFVHRKHNFNMFLISNSIL